MHNTGTKERYETNERYKTNELYRKHKQTNARYTKRTNDTRSERTMHERTNHWRVTIYYPISNDSGYIEVQYNIVLLFE